MDNFRLRLVFEPRFEVIEFAFVNQSLRVRANRATAFIEEKRPTRFTSTRCRVLCVRIWRVVLQPRLDVRQIAGARDFKAGIVELRLFFNSDFVAF